MSVSCFTELQWKKNIFTRQLSEQILNKEKLMFRQFLIQVLLIGASINLEQNIREKKEKKYKTFEIFYY